MFVRTACVTAKSIASTLTPLSRTWAPSIERMTSRAGAVSPVAATGRVSQTCNAPPPAAIRCWSSAIAAARRAFAAGSASALPSMSKSAVVTP